jgi:hypothetical protein
MLSYFHAAIVSNPEPKNPQKSISCHLLLEQCLVCSPLASASILIPDQQYNPEHKNLPKIAKVLPPSPGAMFSLFPSGFGSNSDSGSAI